MRRVLVTGIGCASPLGSTVAELTSAALSGESAVVTQPPETVNGVKDLPLARASLPNQWRQDSQSGIQDRSVLLSRWAADQALHDAQLVDAPSIREAMLSVGTGAGSFELLEGNFQQWLSAPSALHPLSVLRGLHNSVAADLSVRLCIQGPSRTFAMACASGASALANAYESIQAGRRRVAVVCGVEAPLCNSMLAGWLAMRIHARSDDSPNGHGSVAFGKNRSGIVLGEAAVCMVLEDESSAHARGVEGHIEILSVGESSDAHHLVRPSASGQHAAMNEALKAASLTPADIGYINAHGTGTRAGDAAEAASISSLFGKDRPWVSSTKGMHGHTLGAAGLLELAVTTVSMRSGILIPTHGLAEMGSDCPELNHVPELMAWPSTSPRTAISNSFAFGGSNVSIVIGLPQ